MNQFQNQDNMTFLLIYIKGDLIMNKKKIVLASTLAILIAPTILGNIPNNVTSAPVQAATASNNNLIGTVDYGGADAVDGKGNKIDLFLTGKSSWKLGPSITINNQTYYTIGNNQYVNSQNINISTSVPKELPFLIKETSASQTGTLKYAVKVIDQYGNPDGVVLPAGSSWKLNNLYIIGVNTYYKVATNEYVPEEATTLNTVTTTTTPAATKKVGLLMSDSKVVDAAGRPNGVTLPSGSSWQLGSSVQIGGNYYYQVATNEYILVSTVHVQGTNAVDKPVNPGTIGTANSVNTTINLTNASKILDDNGNDTGRTLPAGSSWHADQTKTMHNYLYYRVATNEWVTNGGFYGSEQIFANGPVSVTLTKDVQLYDTSSNSMTRFLAKGTAWRAVKSIQNNKGQFFIQVSSNEWIPLAQGIFVDYSDGNTLYNGFAYSSTYEPEFATNILK